MNELSLIEFLKKEVSCFRELLSSFIAEELAYKAGNSSLLPGISHLQKQILQEIKNLRDCRFKPFNPQDEVDYSLVCILKGQLDSLVDQLKSQKERNSLASFIKIEEPLKEPKKLQVELETDEDMC